MKLAPDWKLVLRKAWSVRLMLLAALLSGLEILLPFFEGSVPRGCFAALSFCTVSGAFVSRLLAQKEFDSED